MADGQKTEIIATLSTRYDGKGAADAKRDLEDLAAAQQEANKPAASGAQTVAPAQESLPAATGRDREIQKSELLKKAMQLETLTRRELRAEIVRLTSALKSSAAAGNTEQYARLKRELEGAKQAMERLNTASNMSTAALAGQALTGMNMANSISSLAEKAHTGTLKVGDLTNGVIGLTMAMKAGLGPIGLVMMAVQGLQLAWDSYQEAQKAAVREQDRQAKIARDYAEGQRAWRAKIDERDAADRKVRVAAMKQQLQQEAEAQEEALNNDRKSHEQIRKMDEIEDQRKIANIRTRLDTQLKIIAEEERAGELTSKQADDKSRAAEDAAQAEIDAAEIASLQRQKSEHEVNMQSAKDAADALKQQLDAQLTPYEALLNSDLPTPEEYQALISRVEAGLGTAEDERKDDELDRKTKLIAEQMAKAGIYIGSSASEVINWLGELKQIRSETQKLIDSYEQQATDSQRALELDDQEIAAKRDQLEVTKAATAANRETEDAARLRESIAKSLGDLDQRYKVSRSYAQQSTGTEAARIEADRQALAARREELTRMKRTPNLPKDVYEQINAALKATNDEIRGMQAEIARARVGAQKSLQNWQPPDLKTSNKTLSGNLKAMEQAYAQAAKRMERAAARGDDQGMERAKKTMAGLGAKIEEITGNTGKMLAKFQSDIASATKIRLGAKGDGLTADQAQANKVRREFGLNDRFKGRKQRTVRRDGDLDEETDRRKSTPSPFRQRQQRQPAQPQTAKAPDMQPATKAATDAANNTEQLTQQVQQLTSALTQLASASGQLGSSTSSAIKAVQQQVAKIQQQIASIKTRL